MCTEDQKSKMEKPLETFKDEIEWNVYEPGTITDEEIYAFGVFTEDQKIIIKKMYAEYPKNTFPNPMCALY